MARYVALLGSINVGGNRLKMNDLAQALCEAGLADVRTVAASGNVLFDHAEAADDALATTIEEAVLRRFGIASFAAVRSADEIARTIAANPFARDGEPRFVHTLFLETPVSHAAVQAFAASFGGAERIAGGGREVHIDYATGVARSGIDPALRKAKVFTGRATARNIRSLQRILDQMES